MLQNASLLLALEVFGTGAAESMEMHESCYYLHTLRGVVRSKQVLKNDWECSIDNVIHVPQLRARERAII